MLENLKILDLTSNLPGPFAAWRLSELGAKVIKIESPNRDIIISDSHKVADGVSACDAWLNHAKEDIIKMNLKDPKDLEEFKRLVKDEGYNIILESYRPGTLKKLGISYEELKELDEGVIVVSISGFGQYGPNMMKASHDLNATGASGLADYSGSIEEGPTHQAYQTTDIIAGHNAIIGLLAAANNRQNTGKGSHVDISMLDGMIPLHSSTGADFLGGGPEPQRGLGLLTGGTLYDYYKTKDGRYFTVASIEQKFFEGLCKLVGKEEWIEETFYVSDLETKKQQLREIFLSKTMDEWNELLEGKDICVEPVATAKEAFATENAKERGFFKEVEFKGAKVKVFNEPIKFL